MVKNPKIAYEGELEIVPGVKMKAAVLDDGTRVLTRATFVKAIGRKGKVKGGREYDKEFKVPVFLTANNLKPYVPKDLLRNSMPIVVDSGKQESIWYKAELLPHVCGVFIDADEAGVLLPSQRHIAQRCKMLLRGFATVGIIALVDEATGYQYDRKHDALRILLKAYIEEELQEWVKTFPDSFFSALDNLYLNEKTTSRNRPKYYGHFINRYIYKPIERGYVKQELDKRNITDKGKRRAQFHRWLTDHGRKQLLLRIGKIEGLMEASPNKRRFEENVKRLTQPSLFDQLDDWE